MSADQGLPPVVPPPGDDEAREPVELPPWLQGADEPAEPGTDAPLPPPPSGLPPP
ncbi:MAG: RDD family protein, partial [Anaerolineae bacterium]|nr:RDD family protein [Anaerolineae bacterium]